MAAARFGVLVAVAGLCTSRTLAQLSGVEGRVPPPNAADWVRVIGGYHMRVCRRGSACADDADRGVKSTYYANVGIFTVHPIHAAPDISLILGGSVDAFYDVKGTIENGRIEGTGHFDGSSAAPSPVDTVVGVRIGPPDITPCIAAAHALAARWGHRS